MVRARRVKRDSVEHIYATCKAAGTCPPDVVNKMEMTTTADQILQWGSAGVYLGGSGIQTAGKAGFRPLGRPPVQPRPPARVFWFPGMDPAGAPALSIGGVYIPEEPSIITEAASHIPLVEAPTEPAVVVSQPRGPPTRLPPPIADAIPGGGEQGIELQVFNGRSAPEVIAGPKGHAVVQPRTTVSTTSHYGNPAFEVAPSTADVVGETSAAEVVHVAENAAGGVHVSAVLSLNDPQPPLDVSLNPEVELELFDLAPNIGPDDPSIMQDTAFARTSTPVRDPVDLAPSRPTGRQPKDSIWTRLFGRRVEQIPVMEDIFLTRPQELVQFDNPAFEQSVSMIFANDVREVAAAPAPEFTDVVRLGAPIRTRTATGRLRLSRLGQRGNIRTRTGRTIGPTAHYYRELSTIVPDEVIEMRVLGEHTGAATVVQGEAETALASYPLPGDAAMPDSVPDDQLLEHDLVTIDLTQSVFGSIHENLQVPIYTWRLPEGVPVTFADIGGATNVDYPIAARDIVPAIRPPMPDPAVVLNMFGTTYYLHPSLLRRKRKQIIF